MVFRAILGKIKQGLAKTREVFFTDITELFRLRGRVDRDFLEQLEKRLYLADVGSFATQEIVDRVRQAFQDKEITGVFVVRDGVAKFVPVRTGIASETSIEIFGEVKAGESIVAGPYKALRELKPDTKVKPETAGAKRGGGGKG